MLLLLLYVFLNVGERWTKNETDQTVKLTRTFSKFELLNLDTDVLFSNNRIHKHIDSTSQRYLFKQATVALKSQPQVWVSLTRSDNAK